MITIKLNGLVPTYVLLLQSILVRLCLLAILLYRQHDDEQHRHADGQQGAR